MITCSIALKSETRNTAGTINSLSFFFSRGRRKDPTKVGIPALSNQQQAGIWSLVWSGHAQANSYTSIKFSLSRRALESSERRTDKERIRTDRLVPRSHQQSTQCAQYPCGSVSVCVFGSLFPLCADGLIKWPPTRVWIRAPRRRSRIPGRDHWTVIRKTEIPNARTLAQVTMHPLSLLG